MFSDRYYALSNSTTSIYNSIASTTPSRTSTPDLSVASVATYYSPKAKTIRLPTGVNLYYQEAGDPNSPTLLLLHGFPTSSNYFRNLIPLLTGPLYGGFHVIAPDLPGFGATTCPPGFAYSFQKLAESIVMLLDIKYITHFGMYCMGAYGALVADRVLRYKREHVMGLVIQNGAVPVSDELTMDTPIIKRLFGIAHNPSFLRPEPRSPCRSALSSRKSSRRGSTEGPQIRKHVSFTDLTRIPTPLIIAEDACASSSDDESELAFHPTPELLRQLYTGGDATRLLDAHSYLMDYAMLSQPGQTDVQEALFQDYRREQTAHATWQNASDSSVAAAHIPKLVLWGTDDQICDKSPSLLYYHLNKADCEFVELPGAGHFALEFCNVEEVAAHVMKFFFSKGDQYWSITTY
jgi:pimeloyl-ACP methyl ester carboxylesterase